MTGNSVDLASASAILKRKGIRMVIGLGSHWIRTEYVLAGTLLSIFIAVVTGLVLLGTM